MTDTAEHLRRALSGQYTLEEQIGEGGMSIVFRAYDVRHDRNVAVKVLRPEVVQAIGTDRFLREIQIEARLQHPNILPLYDSGPANGVLFYVMPFIEGESLRGRIEREGQLPIEDAVRIAREVGDAVFYAHTQGLVHRDLKPANILLSSGHALVADFGIAHAVTEAGGQRLTESGIAIGTPAYMSPEQAGGDHVDGRSDVYSLGCVLYEMLAGEPPFTGRTAQAIMARQLQEAPRSIEVVRPKAPHHVTAAVEKALAKVPADRFATAREFVDTLGDEQAAAALIPRRKGSRMARRAGVLGAAAFAVGLGWALWPRPQPDPNKVVVFPLVEQAVDSAGAGAGIDAAIVVGQALEHTEPLKFIDGWRRLSDRARRDIRSLGVDEARRIAREREAQFYLDGVIRAGDDSVVVTLRLHDAWADTVLVQESAAGHVGTQPVRHVASDLSLGAIRRVLPTLVDPGRSIDLAPIATREAGAIALWIQGERAYRMSDFRAALEFYERAVEEDSALAFAALKGAQAASWRGRFDQAEALINVAIAGDSVLPSKYAAFGRGLAAYLQGEGDTAVARLREALALDAEWSEAHMALGEVLYHLLPSGPVPLDSAALASFMTAADLDSGFAPPLIHLAESAIRAQDAESARFLAARLETFRADPSLLSQLRLMADCVEDGQPAVGWEAAARLRPRVVLLASKSLAARAAHPACAEAGFKGLLSADALGPEYHWGAFLGLQGLLAAQRRTDELVALIDSMVTAGTQLAMPVYVIDAIAGVPVRQQAADVMAFLRDVFGTEYERLETPETLWLAGAWHARFGDVRQLQAVWRRLRAVSATSDDPITSGFERAVAAHVAVARGDTSQGVAILRRLPVTGRRDTLEWNLWRTHPAERLALAEIQLARGEYQEAHDVAGLLDHPAPITYLPFLRASLEIRQRAAAGLGRRRLEARYRDRISALDNRQER